MNDEDGWKEHGEWHYRRETWKKVLIGFAVALGAVAVAIELWVLTVILFLL